ncbi:hypothetical protein BJF78_13455 [Pseudonocardia sp. CNS-139]|nr:hypothetical protein BJF78_13455 [Pseudonocardia sp. CNS-139]
MSTRRTAGGQRSGRPRKLTEDDLVRAVLAEGFAGITVPAVARRLGVSTMTLYRYTPNRAELLSLAWNHVIAGTVWPPVTGHWRPVLRAHAVALWQVLARHPGVVTELSGLVVPAEMMRRGDDMAVLLVEHGFSPPDAVLALDLVMDLTIDHRRGVETIHGLTGTPATLDALADAWEPSASDPPARRAVRAAMHDAIRTGPFDWYTKKLDLALDGIAHRLAPPVPAAEGVNG